MTKRLLASLVVVAAGCSSRGSAAPQAKPQAGATSTAPTPPPASQPSSSAPKAALVELPAGGTDFGAQAKELFRIAACGGTDAIPSRFDAKMVAAHCKDLQEKYDDYKTNWVANAMPFITKLRPAGIPTSVVYPFGGGDLMTALATYPDALEYTTISLEAAGDVRLIDTITEKRLSEELQVNRDNLRKLFAVAHSRTENLEIESHDDIPGFIIFTLAGLAIHGYEPVGLRYFRFNEDGTLKYLTADDLEKMSAKFKHREEMDREVFGDMELTFRKAGDPNAPLKVLRHVSYDLSDKHLKADPSLIKHLESKGKVSAMTKAASHLLWADEFSTIRNYLTANMAWMISDDTGVPPRFATKAGFVQDTYGTYEGASEFGTTDNEDADAFKKLFKANPHTDLPFHYYGYPDNAHHGHIVVTRPKS